jgi:hypothetical protein
MLLWLRGNVSRTAAYELPMHECVNNQSKDADDAPASLLGDIRFPSSAEPMEKLLLCEGAKYRSVGNTDLLVSVFNEEFRAVYKVPVHKR